MTRALEKAIKNWLEAERGGDPARAELALRRAFLRLPLHAPPPDFAATVLGHLGITVRAFAPRLTLRWKVALGACFALTALAVAILPRFVADLWIGIGPSKLVELGAGLLVSLTSRLAIGITVWDALSSVARIVSISLASPQMMAAVGGAALLCAVALRWLHGLLISERNASYAHSD